MFYQRNIYAIWGFMLVLIIRTSKTRANNTYHSVEQIQKMNLEILQETLSEGWNSFCNAPVDESVMSLFNGVNPSDGLIYVMTLNNQSIELPIKSLSELRDFDINPIRKTLVYVNGYYTPDSLFSVQSHLKHLQTTRRDLNVIIVDFAQDVMQLYFSVKHHVHILATFVTRILALLITNGISPSTITLAGHSVGANIAALSAKLYAQKKIDGKDLNQVIAIDPALMCSPRDIHVNANACKRVVVIHGEGDVFGVRAASGTIDIYPNGIGFFPRRKYQPGCETNICSHMYSFILFMEALVEGVMIPAVKCDTWAQFRRKNCEYNNTLAIGITYPQNAAGVYFCVTQPSPPFTFMEHGLRYRKTTANKI
ncbi:lipase member H [Teleopsis dalmanni]|uniref:lipase member H n=1 Tax=Teleopsis dalmanni TaxID=139649 RepID=UPI0018CF1847|nr:lipase member H [Teleopsis dalmanni]